MFQVKAERDDLEKDVENLCMQNGNASIFSRSAVLSERIYSTDKELSKAKKQVGLTVTVTARDAWSWNKVVAGVVKGRYMKVSVSKETLWLCYSVWLKSSNGYWVCAAGNSYC